jgi:hypothetical protein
VQAADAIIDAYWGTLEQADRLDMRLKAAEVKIAYLQGELDAARDRIDELETMVDDPYVTLRLGVWGATFSRLSWLDGVWRFYFGGSGLTPPWAAAVRKPTTSSGTMPSPAPNRCRHHRSKAMTMWEVRG